MASERLISRRSGIYPRLGLFLLLLFSLWLMSNATQNSDRFNSIYLWLLVINWLGAFILLALITTNFVKLYKQRRRQYLGSKLTVRLVIIFIVISVSPVSVVYYFSAQFISQGIDSWFDVKVESALEDALELSRSSLDIRMRELLHLVDASTSRLQTTTPQMTIIALNEFRSDTGAMEIALINSSQQIVAFSSEDPKTILPVSAPTGPLEQPRGNLPYAGLEPLADDKLYIRIIVKAPPGASNTLEPLTLHALFPVSEHINKLADSVTEAFDNYHRLVYLRGPLKNSFMLTLFLVLLLSLLSAVWAAFYAAQRLVEPIRALVAGTQAISGGDYSKQLPPAGKDELGLLVRSFNDMTRRIAQARDEARRSQQLAERQRTYLETVLGHLTSGVLTINAEHRLRTGNARAAQILGINMGKLIGERIDTLAEHYNYLDAFVDMLASHITRGLHDWAEEITLFTDEGRKVLMCRGVSMPGGLAGRGGYVIVFEDITHLIQAQRDAAWGEVARRLAHEIKNPLTPIQLAAERMRRRYLKTLSEEDADLLERSTQTIIHQVDTMKEMVNAFAEYARAPQINPTHIDLNALVSEVLDLYRENQPNVLFELALDPQLPLVWADSGRLRQIFNNLIRNALEAVQDQKDAVIQIETITSYSAHHPSAELVISDNGPGFAPDIINQVFEPYITTKLKGTGLGLPIVKKIVEEHNGIIIAENGQDRGARITVRLPIPDNEEAKTVLDATNSPGET